MSSNTGAFREAAPYYVAGRPAYSEHLLVTLRDALGLDGTGLLLDIGCGPGILTLELAPGFDAVMALDPDPGMLVEGERRAAAAGMPGIRWVQGAAEDLGGHALGAGAGAGAGELGPGACRLITFGSSYHWTAGPPVLDAAYDLLEPGGALALIGHRVPGRPEPAGPALPRIPEDEIRALVDRYGSDESEFPRPAHLRATPYLYRNEVVSSRFGHAELLYAPGRPDIVRDADSVIAGFYSTSYAAPRRFGVRRGEFEAALRALLRARAPDGLFWDWPGDTEILLARRRREDAD